MDSNRIQSTSVAPSTPRQTPREDFGQVFSRAVGGVARVASSVLAPALPSGAAAAITSGVTSLANAVGGATRAQPVAAAGTPTPIGEAAVGAGGGQGEAWSLLEAQRLMNTEGQRFQMAYLQMQEDMQRESREFNALSNIMKVRHDSAKAAINNIR